MQPIRLGRWGSLILPLGSRPCCAHIIHPRGSIRFQATAALSSIQETEQPKRKRGRPRKDDIQTRPSRPRRQHVATAEGAAASSEPPPPPPLSNLESSTRSRDTPHPSSEPSRSYPTPSAKGSPQQEYAYKPPPGERPGPSLLPSPDPKRARKSAKLSALHARLSLPKDLPPETLSRCLVDKTADPDSRFNNHALSVLGNDLLGYYTSEHFITHFPRLPQVVLEAAIYAHVGPKALAAIAQDWGTEFAADPGGEVDPGLLQFRRAMPSRRDAKTAQGLRELAEVRSGSFDPKLMTPEQASAAFVRAVVACVYLHGGADRVKQFFKDHMMSRHLDLHSLFTFHQPTRDLSRLCAREGFESPVARLISETGRKSTSPVFVVGVFSGRDKIGEDVGASLDEARWKAAAKALKGWYLYSPKNAVGGGEIMVPSVMEGESGKGRVWRRPHVDDGEVIT